MKFRAEMGIAFEGDLALLEPHLDDLMEQLLAIEDADKAVEDPDITASLASGEAMISMFLDVADLPEAAQKLVAVVRSAIHAIGDGTPGWDELARAVHEQCMAVRPADQALVDA
ncbi:hypothetical protein Sme01_02650 [Sphaerisporangium melleum]|uniref:Uncharacterized protein n=1 Tax=Sphaerisporangium melleum TaxID=321316 RepID=A0A917VBC4_9ACTN|nr:hypothetical protein [Sphaerisporangium melleum]GGK61036.1 hypothetical protein GCM10007964_00190 [Sphaerisporangium melleum]GII67789.1 hypothetical protein Sme01_02650 [Sphaerisporangium melleum]